MLRKAVQGAVVAGAATLLAVGAASPAMAYESEYTFDQTDFGGINVLSDLCINVTDVVTLVDVLTANGGASCDQSDTDIFTKVHHLDAEFDGMGKHHDW